MTNKFFGPFCLASPEIIEVKVCHRQSHKFFDTIYGGMWIFFPVKIFYLPTRFARRGIMNVLLAVLVSPFSSSFVCCKNAEIPINLTKLYFIITAITKSNAGGCCSIVVLASVWHPVWFELCPSIFSPHSMNKGIGSYIK